MVLDYKNFAPKRAKELLWFKTPRALSKDLLFFDVGHIFSLINSV